jgi:hypothetical protein
MPARSSNGAPAPAAPRRARHLLVVLATLLVALGLAGAAASGFAVEGHVHGTRLALLLLGLGLVAGRLEHHRAPAIAAIDVALVLLPMATANYARLAVKWSAGGVETDTIEAALLAAACGAFTVCLWRARPPCGRGHGDAWRLSPWLAAPPALVRAAQRRLEPGLPRRLGTVLGGLVIAAGLAVFAVMRRPEPATAGVEPAPNAARTPDAAPDATPAHDGRGAAARGTSATSGATTSPRERPTLVERLAHAALSHAAANDETIPTDLQALAGTLTPGQVAAIMSQLPPELRDISRLREELERVGVDDPRVQSILAAAGVDLGQTTRRPRGPVAAPPRAARGIRPGVERIDTRVNLETSHRAPSSRVRLRHRPR